MAFDPLFIITDFFCIFQTNFTMTTLSLKEMEKILWVVREKGMPCWLSQFSKVRLENARKNTQYSIFGVDAMPLSLKNLLLMIIDTFNFLVN